MHLTQFTDYALRTLIYVGAKEDSSSLDEISSAYNISRNHLIKAVNLLVKNGFLNTKRGIGGGISLAIPPNEINVGEVVKKTEPNFKIVECFDASNNTCSISPSCKLKNILNDATKAFFDEVSQYTLEDLLENKAQLIKLLN